MRHGLRWWHWLIIAVALASVPVSIYISGQHRNASAEKTQEAVASNRLAITELRKTNQRLCDYTQSQWEASSAFILRFTAPGSLDQADAYALLGPRPVC